MQTIPLFGPQMPLRAVQTFIPVPAEMLKEPILPGNAHRARKVRERQPRKSLRKATFMDAAFGG
jgi:hypothetical protein